MSSDAKQSSSIVFKPGAWSRARLRTMIDMRERICLNGFMECSGMLTHSGSKCIRYAFFICDHANKLEPCGREEIANLAKAMIFPSMRKA